MKATNKNSNYNRGIALISVLIAITFISIIGAALLYITYNNYTMKVMNINSKENFYEADGELIKLSTALRNVSMDGYGDELLKDDGTPVLDADDKPVLKLYNLYRNEYVRDLGGNIVTEVDADGNTILKTKDTPMLDLVQNKDDEGELVEGSFDGTYNITSLVSLAYPDRVVTGSAIECVVPKTVNKGGKTVSDTYIYRAEGGNNKVTVRKNGNTIVFTLSDISVEQRSAEGYVNKIKSDITFKTKAVSPMAVSSGVGECSMLMDGGIDVNSEFTILNIYGDGYFAEYGDIVSWNGSPYTAPANTLTGGTAALEMKQDSKLNFSGNFLVVYGDIVLKDNSCLYIADGNLAVYGSIYLNDDSTLICAGNIYMLSEALPGGKVSSIVPGDGNMSKHVYPSDMKDGKLSIIKEIKKDDFKEVCETLQINDATKDNDGIINRVTRTVTNFNGSGKDLNILDVNYSAGIHGGTEHSVNYHGTQYKVKFNTEGSINGGSNTLFFNLSGGDIREPWPNTTILSKKPLNFQQRHTIALTKIGTDVFNFLRIEPGSSDPQYDPNIHNFDFKVGDGSYGNSMAKVSAGTFIDPECDGYVNTVLLRSTGGGSSKKTYVNSLSFSRYEKDVETN